MRFLQGLLPQIVRITGLFFVPRLKQNIGPRGGGGRSGCQK